MGVWSLLHILVLFCRFPKISATAVWIDGANLAFSQL